MRSFVNPGAGLAGLAGLAGQVQLVPPIQTHIRTGPEACARMQNPMARLQLTFPSPDRRRAATQFYTALNKGRGGSCVYEPKTVDGKPVTAASLHKVLTSGTLGSGVLDVSSVVCSEYGISLPRWVLFLILGPLPVRKPNIQDWLVAKPSLFQQDLEQANIGSSMNLSNGGDSSMDLPNIQDWIAAKPSLFQQDLEQANSGRSMNLSNGGDSSMDLLDGSESSLNLSPGDISEDLPEIIYVDEAELERFITN